MDNKVLVVNSTKYGGTAEIADKIGQVLGKAGLSTDVLPVDLVNDLSSYRAVVLGSAVYMGRWRKEAAVFLKDNEKVLAEQLTWLFSSGPTGEGSPVELMKGWYFPSALKSIADRIKPRGTALFHGVLNMKKLNLVEKWLIKNVKSPVGDFRDWDAIASWTTTIAKEIKETARV